MCDSLGLSDFLTVDVDHKTRCYGCVIKHNDHWSIRYVFLLRLTLKRMLTSGHSFSGDTAPTLKLVEAGMGSTLLIHEASMGDEQDKDA